MNQVFKIMSNGRQVGISVASTQEIALAYAQKALTRQTASKEDTEPDYPDLTAVPLAPADNSSASIVKKLLARIAEAANSRFVTA